MVRHHQDIAGQFFRLAFHQATFHRGFDVPGQQNYAVSNLNSDHTGCIVTLPAGSHRAEHFKMRLIPPPLLACLATRETLSFI